MNVAEAQRNAPSGIIVFSPLLLRDAGGRGSSVPNEKGSTIWSGRLEAQTDRGPRLPLPGGCPDMTANQAPQEPPDSNRRHERRYDVHSQRSRS